MRVLKGDVDILGLGNLLQSLAMHGGEGVLTVFRGSNKKAIIRKAMASAFTRP